MSVFVVRDPAGIELLRTEDWDAAFEARARWNCLHFAEAPEVAEVFEVTPGGERLVDRMLLIAELLGLAPRGAR